MEHYMPVILVATAVILLLALPIIWAEIFRIRARAYIDRELKRHGFVRSPKELLMDIDPAPGYQVLGYCNCTRDGKLYRVIVFKGPDGRPHLDAEPSV